ncbi:MAG: gamma-glutamyl-gamma-aminobutyrate hydrolase family protein [Microcoleus sp. PH2017_15_JOR_U_A]|jgi:putative glutamine amidotransferase|uniref:gamma-glutamyl-gamma-aminobutyrate hydrolase family protein n=1 Tax=unclassified Microcoleus TaxID=2642155 RepID=UPI001DC36B5C|nr:MULTISPECIES: gamma-glutamyl-gamma-aminobutyrate hydrolase family protein [unclassified Microcoleus]TAE46817.1 MAG: gamma-glutamyl-gamma-aminobutyrate hydrolase family protein [Oscillatoriales cyanobacterium]MCC3451899.1 gamma-glutamyl-gamma-aminobutyrate hydrolase family protein [Microcoleus sp. PH2017_09_SFU_O_A]MCC3476466.1 gamma-glutamyl-gamma-aminobutyrate hydrolase family protein [Microcoleus sp. PH2017_13_LAR_U_A]MCC3488925.1 gamma-glutamyl-gamma-aminobutyrate hydrolase family protein
MKKHPIVGITTYCRSQAGEYCLNGAYIDAVQAAGGIPILLPPNQLDPASIFDAVDGLIFSGGGDINPELYGGFVDRTVYSVNAERDNFELSLAKLALRADIPVLGICRGMQVLNVASGGNLVVHVPDAYGEEVTHRQENPIRAIEHIIKIDPDSRLAKIMGTTSTNVVSWHHQAVQTMIPGWQIVARAPDGLIEAIEYKYHPWMVAVQWHPEMSPKSLPDCGIFRAFVEAAASKCINYTISA